MIGHPAHRRVTGFREAAEAAGFSTTVLSHRELLDAPERLLELDETPRILRIDSFGEDVDVERELLALGYEQAEREGAWALDPDALDAYEIRYGEVVAPRQAALGLARQLERIDEVLRERPSWRVLQPPKAVTRLFDKRACWRLHKDHDVRVPMSIAPEDPDGLRVSMRARGWHVAYVKLLSGSSASCLAIYEPGKPRLTTTLTREDGRWFNVLRPRIYKNPDEIETVLAFLMKEGVHVERGLRKARRERHYLDIRVLVVDGEPAFVVERQSRHPITNLHLGGRRGDVDALRRRMDDAAWSAVEATARTVASLHGCFHLGVDVAILERFDDHAVLEANAFGDLLPNLEHDGRSVYEHEVFRLR